MSDMEMREAYGMALLELGEKNPKVVVLDADVGNSTRSILFGARFPKRHFNLGIAELNMAGFAAGMSTIGLIPFINAYAAFMSLRGADPVHNLIAQDSLNVKLVGSYSGYSPGLEGASHQSINDIGIMASMPNMTVISASDNIITKKAVFAIAEHEGPVYLRLFKAASDILHSEDTPFVMGKGITLLEGSDLTILATGSMVSLAVKAGRELRKAGINPTVVDIHTIKPLDKELIINLAKRTGAVVTAEEHSIYGGLGSIVSQLLAANCPVPLESVAIQDVFAQSGGHLDLMEHYGLNIKNIVDKSIKAVKRKKQAEL